MSEQFKTIAESYITRYTNGGFLTQDTVKLAKNYKSDKHYKKLHKDIKSAIEDMFNQGLNIRVIDIISKDSNGGGNDLSLRGIENAIVIAPEIMPGKTDNNQAITVPSTILEIETAYPNLPKIPKKFEYQFNAIEKPVPYEFKDSLTNTSSQEIKPTKKDMRSNEMTRKTYQGKTLKKSDTELKNKNIKISKESVENESRDVLMEGYVSYLQG